MAKLKTQKKNNNSSKHGVLFLDSRNWQLEWRQCFSFFFHNLILVFLVLQKKGGVQEIKICSHNTCHFGTRIIWNWMQLRVDAKKSPCPCTACLKAGLDYLSPETLYQPRNVIHVTSLTNQTLSTISFPHIHSIPQFAILGIANHFSRNLLSFVNTLYISLSCNYCFELLFIEFLPCIPTLHVLNRFCLFFSYLSIFCLSNYGPSQRTTGG